MFPKLELGRYWHALEHRGPLLHVRLQAAKKIPSQSTPRQTCLVYEDRDDVVAIWRYFRHPQLRLPTARTNSQRTLGEGYQRIPQQVRLHIRIFKGILFVKFVCHQGLMKMMDIPQYTSKPTTISRWIQILHIIFTYPVMRLRDFNQKEPVHKDPKKIVIDTHGGLQDILAIVIAHKIIGKSGSQQQIIGLTCVAGKNTLEEAVSSALVVNLILGTKIPIYIGQCQSLMLSKSFPKSHLEQNFTHIENHLYTEVDKVPELRNLVQKEKASDYLIRVSHQHKNSLAVIALGPHTNLGLAHRIEDCFNHIGMVGLNGGQYMGVGSTVNGLVQANFAHDPLASSILFEKRESGDLREILYTNPLEHTLTFNWRSIINSCLEYEGDIPHHPLFDSILQNSLSINGLVLQNGPLLALLPVVAPKTVKKMYRVFAQIVRDGYQLDGLMGINWLKDGGAEGEYPDNLYIYGVWDEDLIATVVREAVLAKN